MAPLGQSPPWACVGKSALAAAAEDPDGEGGRAGEGKAGQGSVGRDGTGQWGWTITTIDANKEP